MKVLGKWLFSIIMMLLLVFIPSVSHALTLIAGSGGLNDLGSYTGYLDYNKTEAELKVVLTNTSPLSNGGYITAFVFNKPFDYIKVETLTSTDSDFYLLGGDSFDNSINGAPFGQFDIGAGLDEDGKNFKGGGKASDGIGVGSPENSTETFLFSLTGTNLQNLTEQSFLSSLSAPNGDGEGHESFLVRFRGFKCGFGCDDSDKVPGYPVPEPATMLLLGAGLFGLAGIRRKRK